MTIMKILILATVFSFGLVPPVLLVWIARPIAMRLAKQCGY